MTATSLPAFARPLIALRMAGRHPLFVNVLFSRDWAPATEWWQRRKAEGGRRKCPVFSPEDRKAVGDPWIAIGPRQFEAGRFDLRCVAGCWVMLHDPDAAAARDESAVFYDLVRELAGQAYVWFESGPLAGHSADWVACVSQLTARAWPRWWSDDLDRAHERRRQEWTRAYEIIFPAASAA